MLSQLKAAQRAHERHLEELDEYDQLSGQLQDVTAQVTALQGQVVRADEATAAAMHEAHVATDALAAAQQTWATQVQPSGGRFFHYYFMCPMLDCILLGSVFPS